jgi:hypothetical protein
MTRREYRVRVTMHTARAAGVHADNANFAADVTVAPPGKRRMVALPCALQRRFRRGSVAYLADAERLLPPKAQPARPHRRLKEWTELTGNRWRDLAVRVPAEARVECDAALRDYLVADERLPRPTIPLRQCDREWHCR